MSLFVIKRATFQEPSDWRLKIATYEPVSSACSPLPLEVNVAFDDRTDSRIGGERRALLGRRHLHGVILLAAVLSFAAADRPSRALPKREAKPKAVIVPAGREHLAHVEELAGSEDAVVVGPKKLP